MKPRQLPLDLPVESASTREDLIVGASNARAVELLDSWPDWPSGVMILAGPAGSGKSHMARIWARQAEATLGSMKALAVEEHPVGGHVVLEDAEPGAIDEKALFHLLNHCRAENSHCLITSRLPPAEWNVALADLKSRLMAAHVAGLEPPDDEMLRMVVVKLLADRQLTADPGVLSYIASRMERSLEAAARVVEEIDRESLARAKRITRPIAAAALDRLGMD